MRGEVATILIVVALIVGAGIGFFSNTTAISTTTETIIKTYTTTTTFPQGGSGVVRRVLTRYAVWEIARFESNTASFSSTTVTSDLQTYQITTSVIQTVGWLTTSTSSYTGTVTGALAEGNHTVCTYISG